MPYSNPVIHHNDQNCDTVISQIARSGDPPTSLSRLGLPSSVHAPHLGSHAATRGCQNREKQSLVAKVMDPLNSSHFVVVVMDFVLN